MWEIHLMIHQSFLAHGIGMTRTTAEISQDNHKTTAEHHFRAQKINLFHCAHRESNHEALGEEEHRLSTQPRRRARILLPAANQGTGHTTSLHEKVNFKIHCPRTSSNTQPTASIATTGQLLNLWRTEPLRDKFSEFLLILVSLLLHKQYYDI